jgi:hypothetical protein
MEYLTGTHRLHVSHLPAAVLKARQDVMLRHQAGYVIVVVFIVLEVA